MVRGIIINNLGQADLEFMSSKRFNINLIYFGGVLLIIMLLMMVLGCDSSITNLVATPTSTVAATSTPRPNPTAIEGRATTTVVPTPTRTSDDGKINLILWTVAEISPEAEGGPGEFMRDSIRAFERSHPSVSVDVILKKSGGKGGVLDFLRTAKEVAPSVLPDVAIIDATGLNQAYSEGLIQTLNGKLDRSIVQDLLPAARRMGTIQDQLVGVPVGIEMEHTVYNTLSFPEPPLLWSEVLTANTRYLFPAKGVNGLVNDLTLAQYFSAGGRLLDNEGAPTLDERVLQSVLETYEQGVENGIIDPVMLEISTVEEVWPSYAAGQASLAQTRVRQYLTDRELLSNTTFGPFPVQSNADTPVHIMHSWALVLVTDGQDVRRQAATLSLIEWFMSTNNNATWNNINKSIPTRNTSYQQLADDDSYWEFLAEQLNTAQPQPSFPGYDQLGRIIQQAIVQVISGEATAEEATTTAIDALDQ